jgi:hypothetical protein
VKDIGSIRLNKLNFLNQQEFNFFIKHILQLIITFKISINVADEKKQIEIGSNNNGEGEVAIEKLTLLVLAIFYYS